MVILQDLEHSFVSDGIGLGISRSVRCMYVVQQSGQDDTAMINPTTIANITSNIFIFLASGKTDFCCTLIPFFKALAYLSQYCIP